MRKALPYLGAALAALAMTWTTTVKAQDTRPFEDVKPDHWAYQAVTDLQAKGIITGYPDHHFNGQRTLTRYEFAVALKRALDKIQATPGATGPQGPAGPAGPQGDAGPAGPAGPPGMTPQEVDELRRLTQDFKNELAALGMNMRDVQAKLDSLSRAVADINRRLDRMIQFNGDFFIGFRSDRSRYNFLDYSGATRAANNSHFNNVSSPSDFHLEAHANLPGGVKFNGDLVTTNYLSYRGSNLSAGAAALPNAALNQDTFLYEGNLVIPVAQVGSGTTLTVGRYREQVTPLTMYRPDFDAYFNTPWYDDGSYIQDGFEFKAKFGSASTKLFAASYSSVVDSFNGTAFNRPAVGAVPNNFGILPFGQVRPGAILANQVAGVHIGVPLFKYGELGVSLLDFSTSGGPGGGGQLGNQFANGGQFGNVVVYGANVKLNQLGRFAVSGEAAKSVTQRNFDTGDGQSNEDNNAFTLNVGYNSGPITATAGYQYIDPRFAAPGYWNKIGNWYNPTNVQGPFARIGYNATSALSFNLGGDFFSGARNRPGVGNLTTGSNLFRGVAGAKFRLSKQFELSADYEAVLFSLSGAVTPNGNRAKPVEQYITLGAGLNLTGNTVLKMAYQIINIQDAGNGFGLATFVPGGTQNASVFTTQVAVHF